MPPKSLLYALSATVLALFALPYLLPPLLPLLIAILLATAIEPAVRWLICQLRLSRPAASGLCCVVLIGGLLTFVTVLGTLALRELRTLTVQTPEVLSELTAALDALRARVQIYAFTLPVDIADILFESLDNLPVLAADILGAISRWLVSRLGEFAQSTPDALLFTVTTALGSYFTSAEYPELSELLKARIPAPWLPRLRSLRTALAESLGAMLRAQFILMCMTFAELLIAFTLLRVEYALLTALLLAILDALPVIGTGTVLIPWGLLALAQGDRALGAGLLISYCAVTLVRNLAQAKLVGDELGLRPIAALAAIYIGFKCFGVAGMLLAPIAALLVKQLYDHAYRPYFDRQKN